jgi:ribosome-associated protein
MEIPRDRLEIRFSRSGGPGGQNVNKVETKVEVRFRLAGADWIPSRVRVRLEELYPRRITADGEFVIASSRYRSQAQNVADCFAKLRACLHKASEVPRLRVPTRPTRSSSARRLDSKRRRSARKQERRWRPGE